MNSKWSYIGGIIFDFSGLFALGWIVFHLILIELYGEVVINAPCGEQLYEIGLLLPVIGLGIWKTIRDMRRI